MRYFCVALRASATELQAVIVALREVGVAWKLIASGLLNTERTCHRRRRDLIASLDIDEFELSQILRGNRAAPHKPRRRRTQQERPFRRPDFADCDSLPMDRVECEGAMFMTGHKHDPIHSRNPPTSCSQRDVYRSL